jgi:amino acid transporter
VTPIAPGETLSSSTLHRQRLVKSLRRADIVFLIVAAVISMDTIGSIAGGGGQALVWAVVLAGTFLIPYAMVFAETGAAFPQEGGPYQWVKLSFGRGWAGVATVMYWITNPIWLGGSLAFIAAKTWSAYVMHIQSGSFADYAFKLAFIWVAIELAVVSLRTGKRLINAGAVVKVIVLGALPATAAIYGIEHGFTGLTASSLSPTTTGFLAILPVLIFAYVGFEAPSGAAEEMFDAQRDTPPAIRRGSIISMVAYLVPVLAIVLVTPAGKITNITGFMSAIAQVYSVYGPAAHALLTITAIAFVLALVNQGSAWMIATDRMQAIAAADGAFFSGFFGQFSRRLFTPVRVNILSGVTATVFTVAATLIINGSAGAAFGVVLNCAISTLLMSYLIIIPALIKLRLARADVSRPYRVPGATRGFLVLAGIVLVYIVVGNVAAIFPSALNSALGIGYSFEQTWGVSGGQFELFTLGTLAVVILLGVVGYLAAGPMRKRAGLTAPSSTAQLDGVIAGDDIAVDGVEG